MRILSSTKNIRYFLVVFSLLCVFQSIFLLSYARSMTAEVESSYHAVGTRVSGIVR